MTRPNILLLMTDQQRWDALGCTGGWARTPALDRIAAEGTRFTNCVSNSPVCIPTRLSLATGLYPHNTGVWNNLNHQMSPQQPTWMQAVREAGYRTSLFGKTHLHPHGGDLREREGLMHLYGLDDVDEIGGPRASARCLSHMTVDWAAKGKWEAYREDYAERFGNVPHVVRPSTLGLEDYADRYVGDRSRRYLREYDRDEPWCCWVSFGGPHEPWDAPEPYASMYDPQDMPLPLPLPDDGRDGDRRPRGVLDGRLASRPSPTPDEIAAMRANYAGNVTLIDDEIAGIIEVIEARGEWDNTVVVMSSDHGEMNGDFELIYKSQFLNSASRVPLLVRAPGRTSAGGVCTSPVEWFDIGPTLVEVAGGELRHRHFARSLGSVMEDPQATHRREALCELDGEIMLLDEEWKMSLNSAGQCYLLYDRQGDPDEQRTLAGDPDHRDRTEALRLRILERLVQSQPNLHSY